MALFDLDMDTLGAGVRGLLENPALTRLAANRERPQPFGDYASAQGSLWDQHGATGQAGGNLFAQAGLGGDPFAQGTRPVYGSAGSSYDRLARVASLALGHASPLGAGVGKGAAVAATTATVPQTGTPTGSGGPYGSHEQYRASIQKWAQAQGIDPDALAAILQIETGGDPHAVSPAGARGLGQIMPGTWAGLADPGDDPFDPDASIKNAAKYYAGLYRQFGDYGLAAAAYQGGPGAIVNGAARDDVSDGNLTPRGYAARWAQNYQGIKGAAPAAAPQATTQGGYAFPVEGYTGKVALHWGESANAADIMAPEGTNILSLGNGVVQDASWNNLGGWTVTMRLDSGQIVYMAHLRQQAGVQPGQRVQAGQLLGQVGTTGNAAGGPSHLHIGIGSDIQSGSGPEGGAGTPWGTGPYDNAVGLLNWVLGGAGSPQNRN